MEDLKYCICCGEDVPYNRIERDGKTELTCSYCGFPLPDDEKTVVPMEDTSQKDTSKVSIIPHASIKNCFASTLKD